MRIDPTNPINQIMTSPIAPVPSVNPRPGIDKNPGHSQDSENDPGTTSGQQSPRSPVNLTPDALRSALIELGISADNESVQIAESLTRLGLPITEQSIADARSVLVKFPTIPIAAYALAKALNAPITLNILQAFTQVVNGALENNPVPQHILDQLAVSMPASADSTQVVRELYQMLSRLGRSTEQTLTIVNPEPDTSSRALFHADPKAQLLITLALNPNITKALAATIDSHAAHIEGQQLLNQSALNQSDKPGQLYFAFPISMGEARNTITEVLVQSRDENKPDGEADPDGILLQATIRLKPPRLGTIEVGLTGTKASQLSVKVHVEQESTLRYINRESSSLITGLTQAGWVVKRFGVEKTTEFEPLWTGGAELKHPRHRVDQIA
jgi:hypothetical protein